MKPHITPLGGAWTCRTSDTWPETGTTPSAAYQAWLTARLKNERYLRAHDRKTFEARVTELYRKNADALNRLGRIPNGKN